MLTTEENEFLANVKKGNIKALENMLKLSPVLIKTRDNDGITPIHYAALHGYIPILEFLITKGLKIDSEDNNGRTVLHYAASQGHIPFIEFLIQLNPDLLKAVDNLGKTALDCAIKVDTKNYLKTKQLELDQNPSKNSNSNNYNLTNNTVQSNIYNNSINLNLSVNAVIEKLNLELNTKPLQKQNREKDQTIAYLQKQMDQQYQYINNLQHNIVLLTQENKQQAQLIEQLKNEIIILKAQLKSDRQSFNANISNTPAVMQIRKQDDPNTTTISVASFPFKEVNNSHENQLLSDSTNVKKKINISNNHKKIDHFKSLEFMATVAVMQSESSELTHIEREKNKRNNATFEASSNKRQRG